MLDATTGQNGISQARHFTDAVRCTGIVLAKLDGTAKGGVVVAIRKQVGLPVKYIGVGEQGRRPRPVRGRALRRRPVRGRGPIAFRGLLLLQDEHGISPIIVELQRLIDLVPEVVDIA